MIVGRQIPEIKIESFPFGPIAVDDPANDD
jgi:hypothetical protein